jgi:hypothetical protein
MSLRTLLSNAEGRALLEQHLVTEYSVENLKASASLRRAPLQPGR